MLMLPGENNGILQSIEREPKGHEVSQQIMETRKESSNALKVLCQN